MVEDHFLLTRMLLAKPSPIRVTSVHESRR